jgi:hypothetical protein
MTPGCGLRRKGRLRPRAGLGFSFAAGSQAAGRGGEYGGRGLASGYVFVAPKLGEGEHGPMIFDDAGRPVWFRDGLYALNFRVQEYRASRC